MTNIKVWLPLLIEIVGAIYIYKELVDTSLYFNDSKKILGSVRHTAEHILLLIFMIACNVAFVVILFAHRGTENAIDMMANHSWWIPVVMFGFLKMYTTFHLKGERLSRI